MGRLLHASTLANPSVRNDGVQWGDCFVASLLAMTERKELAMTERKELAMTGRKGLAMTRKRESPFVIKKNVTKKSLRFLKGLKL